MQRGWHHGTTCRCASRENMETVAMTTRWGACPCSHWPGCRLKACLWVFIKWTKTDHQRPSLCKCMILLACTVACATTTKQQHPMASKRIGSRDMDDHQAFQKCSWEQHGDTGVWTQSLRWESSEETQLAHWRLFFLQRCCFFRSQHREIHTYCYVWIYIHTVISTSDI